MSGLHRRSQVILEDPGMDGTRFDPLTLARPDGGSAPVFHEDTVLPRAEVLRRLRWQQREWARMLATHGLDTPCLVAPGDGPGLNDTLDLLQEAGEVRSGAVLPPRVAGANHGGGERYRGEREPD